jgi:hypothetical protein
MTPRLLLRPEAHADLEEAFQWYEERARFPPLSPILPSSTVDRD